MQSNHVVLKVLVESDDLQGVEHTARFTIVSHHVEVSPCDGALTGVTPLVELHGILVDESLNLRRASDGCT